LTVNDKGKVLFPMKMKILINGRAIPFE